MALYGGNLVDVTTPDGRRVSMPADLAANFEGLSPVPPPVPELPPDPQLGAPAAQTPLSPPLDVPSFTPEEVQQFSAPPAVPGFAPPQVPQAAPDGVVAPAPSPVVAPAEPAKPPPPQLASPLSSTAISNKELGKTTNADVLNQQNAVIDSQSGAVSQLATVEADEATRIGNEKAAKDAEVDRILLDRKASADKFAADLDKRMSDYDRGVKELANIKIDRKADYEGLGMLAILVGGIGAALEGKGGPNLAFDAYYKGIDRKVQGQMQDLEIKRGNLAQQKDRLGMQRELNRDALAEFDQRRTAEIDRSLSKIETIKATSQSDKVIANANLAQANLEGKKAEIRAEAVQREHDRLRAEQARKDALAAQAQARKDAAKREADAKAERDRNFAEGVRQFDVQQGNAAKNAAAVAQGKGGEEFRKLDERNEERGIKFNGKLLLQSKGQQIVDAADAAAKQAQEMVAKAQTAPPGEKEKLLADAQTLQRQSDQARLDAERQFAVRAGTTEERTKIAAQLASTQTGVSLLDKIANLRESKGTNYLTTSEFDQQMQSMMGTLVFVIKDAYAAGALDQGLTDVIKGIVGDSPEKITGNVLTRALGGSDSTVPKLRSAADSLVVRARNNLGAYMDAPERFDIKRDIVTPRTEAEKTAIQALQDQSPIDAAKGEETTGILGNTVDFIKDNVGQTRFFQGKTVEQQRQDAAASTGDEYGLSEKQRTTADQQLQIYLGGSNKDAAKRAGETLVAFAADRSAPGRSNAFLSRLQSDAPDLYEQAISRLPADVRTEITGIRDTTARAAAETLPIAMIRDGALSGQQEDLQELVRRAGAGDRDAVAVVQEVLDAKRQAAAAAKIVPVTESRN